MSCLNRPFDDQRQAQIRLESEAVTAVMAWWDAGALTQVASEMSLVEIDVIRDPGRRRSVFELPPPPDAIIKLTPALYRRAEALRSYGLKAVDAVHVAAAEAAGAEVFLTCDERLLRACQWICGGLTIGVKNPVDWVKEISDAPDIG